MNQNNLTTKKAKAGVKELPVAFGSNGFKLMGKVLCVQVMPSGLVTAIFEL